MNYGFIGTGNIVSDVISGISKSKIKYGKIIISPRNKKKAFYLRKYFKNVGFSDHTQGIKTTLNSINLSPFAIEKHFTTDKTLPGRDNKFAILPNELATLSNYKKNLKKFGKKRGLGLLSCEKDIFKNYRGRWSKKIN